MVHQQVKFKNVYRYNKRNKIVNIYTIYKVYSSRAPITSNTGAILIFNNLAVQWLLIAKNAIILKPKQLKLHLAIGKLLRTHRGNKQSKIFYAEQRTVSDIEQNNYCKYTRECETMLRSSATKTECAMSCTTHLNDINKLNSNTKSK